jgi:hypothetical protein
VWRRATPTRASPWHSSTRWRSCVTPRRESPLRPRDASDLQLTFCGFARRVSASSRMLHAAGAIDSPDAAYTLCYFATKARSRP